MHLGSRAAGGAGLVLTEAAAVDPRGRISPADLGIWDDQHVPGLQRVASFIRAHGAVAGIQLAHAGRKASTSPPWEGGRAVPSRARGLAAGGSSRRTRSTPTRRCPTRSTATASVEVVAAFRQAAARAREAGFQVVEIHAAHGYLIHEFLSPLTNHRTDEFGGSYDNRTRLLKQVCKAVRDDWPADHPLFVRVSSTDWADGGWRAEDTVALAHHLSSVGVDLVDCSSGGIAPGLAIPSGPGYQVPFSQRIKDTTPMLTAAVGVITSPAQADQIIRNEQADLVLLGARDAARPLLAAAGRPRAGARRRRGRTSTSARSDRPQMTPRPARVQLFATCLVDQFFPAAGHAAVAVLERFGVEVHVPPDQTCCGQPAFNGGFAADAAAMARTTIDVLSHSDDPVVVPSGSCADMIVNHYPELLAGDAVYGPRAKALAARTYEFSQFLVDVLGVDPAAAPSGPTLAYHASCHGLRGLGLREQPRRLLHAVAGDARPISRTPRRAAGSAASSRSRWVPSPRAMLDSKLDAIERSGADVVVATDVSCLMHIGGGLHRRGSRGPSAAHRRGPGGPGP